MNRVNWKLATFEEKQNFYSELVQLADKTIYIQMNGFVESFNVSVCCGVVLHHLTLGMEEAGISRGLDEEDALNTKIKWALRTIPNPQHFL